jgi:hypothetical protein
LIFFWKELLPEKLLLLYPSVYTLDADFGGPGACFGASVIQGRTTGPPFSTKQPGSFQDAGLKLIVSEVCTETGRPFMV